MNNKFQASNNSLNGVSKKTAVNNTNNFSEEILNTINGLERELGSEGIIQIAQKLERTPVYDTANALEHSKEVLAQQLANGGQVQFFEQDFPVDIEPQYTNDEMNTII